MSSVEENADPGRSEVAAQEESHITNADGVKIYCKIWPAKNTDKPRAAVFLCHGAGEHCGCYDDISARIAEKGLLLFTHDHYGHGKSEGEKVQMPTMEYYMRDVVQHTEQMKEKYPDIPYFIIGHSMGGALAFQLSLNHPNLFSGMVLWAPCCEIDPTAATPTKVFFGKLVAKILPSYKLDKIDPKFISSDPEVVKKYEEDPLVYHDAIKARFAVNLLNIVQDVQKRVADIKQPYLMIHGTEDRLCALSGTELVHKNASSHDKTLQVLDGMKHQVHNEPSGVGEKVVNDTVEWICSHINTEN